MEVEFSPGDIVQATYKTGHYVGEVIEVKKEKRKAVIQVLGVLRHPRQGDLHQPGQANVAMFHERRALSYREYALVTLSSLHPYEGEIPDYKNSLHEALHLQMHELEKDKSEWAKLSLEQLQRLKADYNADHQ